MAPLHAILVGRHSHDFGEFFPEVFIAPSVSPAELPDVLFFSKVRTEKFAGIFDALPGAVVILCLLNRAGDEVKECGQKLQQRTDRREFQLVFQLEIGVDPRIVGGELPDRIFRQDAVISPEIGIGVVAKIQKAFTPSRCRIDPDLMDDPWNPQKIGIGFQRETAAGFPVDIGAVSAQDEAKGKKGKRLRPGDAQCGISFVEQSDAEFIGPAASDGASNHMIHTRKHKFFSHFTYGIPVAFSLFLRYNYSQRKNLA